MRAIPEALAAKLEAGATTLAHVWRIARRDGQVFGFTDHDRALVLDGLTCLPTQGVTPGAIEKSLGLAVDTASLSGALSSEALSAEDLARGLWDGARVDVYRVDWSASALQVHLFAGYIGEVRRGAAAFEAELRGLQAALNTPVGRVFSRFCDADVGDVRCGIDLEDTAFRGEAVVTELIDTHAFRVSGLAAFADGWFTRGRLMWDEGGGGEIAVHRAESGGAVIEMTSPPGPVLTLGAGCAVTAGCDKRFETCRDKFANALNFRGFPHMPGNDAVQAGPQAGGPLDGGSRWR